MKLRVAALAFGLLSLPALAADPAPKKKPVAAKAHAQDGHSHSEGADCHHPASAAAAAPQVKQDGWVLTRGAPLKGKVEEVQLTHLLRNPTGLDGKTVRVEGRVRKACEKKGCWMELATDDKSPGVRVTFKDYAFFVPLDSAGSAARVEGVVKLAELSEGHAKHYEAEGAIVPRGKDGKYREVQLVASGVELRR